jgi:hypothetical protein
MQLYFLETKLPNLKLKTQPKQLLGSLPLVIALPGWVLKARERGLVVGVDGKSFEKVRLVSEIGHNRKL